LKKRSKKLLTTVRDSPAAHANEQKFFGSFFQKRTLSYFLKKLSANPLAPSLAAITPSARAISARRPAI
jgi:hypothetical protein